MTEEQIEIKVKLTWVQPVALFVCRYIRIKAVLRLLCRLTIARVYGPNGKLLSKVKLGDWINV